MGLINKLFRDNNSNNKHPDVSIDFSEDNIRVLLFRECEFNGRKVLFDTVKRPSKNEEQKTQPTTQKPDTQPLPHSQLAEMVFGSVAMGFSSCCFKIHLLQPKNLMLTQIFPSPRHREKVRESFSSTSSQCLEQSTVFEDSATSSTNSSASDQLSTYSSASDQILGDSLSSLSSGNVYKKWLRSNNCLNFGSGSFGSVKEGASTSSHHRSSKLGFVLIIDVPEKNQTSFMEFHMEHISLFESLMHRARRLIEIAYTKPHTFESSMEEVARLTKRGVRSLVTSPNLAPSLIRKRALQSNCDTYSDAFKRVLRLTLNRDRLFTRLTGESVGERTLHFGNFLNEFCTLMEVADNKNTSFFMSSLITAVLTHHLGWVRSSLGAPTEDDVVYNALWCQLLNLYGAIGHPSKMSQTIVTGNCEDTMAKVLRCVAFFIKCCDINKNEHNRCNVEEEKEIAKEVYEIYYKKKDVHKSLDNINNNYIVNEMKRKSDVTFQKREEKSSLLELPNTKRLTRTKSFANNLNVFQQSVEGNNNKCCVTLTECDFDRFNNNDDIVIKNNEIVSKSNNDNVVFVLGENETLVGINRFPNEELHSNNVLNSEANVLDHTTSLENIMVTSEEYFTKPKAMEKARSEINLCPPSRTKKTSGLNVNKIETTAGKEDNQGNKMRIIKMPMPKSTKITKETRSSPNILSVFKGITDHYIPDMVLQGTVKPKVDWIYKLKNDLALTSQQTQFGKFVEEVVAILANINTWEVHLMSSHTYVIDPNATGIRVYMSHLVSNMLESLYVMWKQKVPVKYCQRHMENKMREICIHSKTLAQLLLKTPICNMETLNSTLHIDVNDVPLLMAIASVHTPEVTQKYGLSFQ